MLEFLGVLGLIVASIPFIFTLAVILLGPLALIFGFSSFIGYLIIGVSKGVNDRIKIRKQFFLAKNFRVSTEEVNLLNRKTATLHNIKRVTQQKNKSENKKFRPIAS